MEYTPFVGRKQDLLLLQVLEARTLEEQRPQLVSIVAPAGTGKTRLVEEFLKRLAPEEGFQMVFARCLRYGQSLTYWPLRGLLSDLLGSEPDHVRLSAVFTRAGYQAEDCFDPKFWSYSQRKPLQAAFPRLRESALEAAAYFEQHQDWAAMHEALDGAAQSTIYMR